MPLYPPPQPVEHPADLVIDAFGTFLGRKSERLIVRWREVDGAASSVEKPGLDEGDPPGSGSSDQVRPADLTAPEAGTGIIDGAAKVRSSGQTASPLSESPALPSLAPDESVAPPHAEQASSQPPHPADQATSELLHLWAQHPASQSQPEVPAPARLKSRLDGVADPYSGRRLSAGWRERAVPFCRLRSVTISGRGITVSSDLIAALVERGISLSFLSGRGQPVAQVSAPGLGGTVQTRRSQLAAYESSLGVDLAVEFIRGKLRNQKHQLQYSGKYLKSADPPRFERLVRKIKSLGGLRKQLADFRADRLEDVRDKLMGYEGTGARVYWEGISILLDGKVEFPGRSTRGAIDPVNSALNYGYGILYGQVSGAIVNAGLEMFAGFLHVDRPGKPALVLDLVEEFRAPVVDRSVLAIVNQGITIDTDAHGLTPPTRRLIADRILERLSTPVPYEGKRWPLATIIQNQARHLAVAVRGERTYRAFASRW